MAWQPVQAQFDTQVIEEATPTQGELGQLIDPTNIEDARAEYFKTVEAYRESEQRYLISQEQYYKLNTVASLDDAIRRGKELLVLRASALRQYFLYQELVLRATTGVDLGDKAAAIEDLEAWQARLRQDETRFLDLEQRSEVDAAFEELNVFDSQIIGLHYRVKVLSKIGELQTAMDTAKGVSEGMRQQLIEADISAADRAIKERGLREAIALLERGQGQLFEELDTYRTALSGNFNRGRHDQFQSAAENIYLLLRQTYAYMDEVLEGIE